MIVDPYLSFSFSFAFSGCFSSVLSVSIDDLLFASSFPLLLDFPVSLLSFFPWFRALPGICILSAFLCVAGFFFLRSLFLLSRLLFTVSPVRSQKKNQKQKLKKRNNLNLVPQIRSFLFVLFSLFTCHVSIVLSLVARDFARVLLPVCLDFNGGFACLFGAIVMAVIHI